MSIEKITSKIMDEAKAERQQVLAEAEARRDAVLTEANEKAQALLRSEEERGLSEKEKVISRRKSVADIDCRKVILQEKQDLIGQCFEEVTQAITDMEEASYIKLLVALGKATGQKEGTLLFNAKEKAAIGQKVAETLSKETGGVFTVAEEERPVRGGYLLRTGNVYINNTIEALVEERKDDLGSEIAAMLFAPKQA